ncbi:hypothetical protein EVAR_18404_1 [Eumeta japonica]|uniref:Uncharacterized protein n=1 Tax=Eumeta variegata TaxID=151549 RepID=A0A4C1UVV1_EUMVA|nr:hypothetical protein EVAR_18404_1 [Eumeta japonica]
MAARLCVMRVLLGMLSSSRPRVSAYRRLARTKRAALLAPIPDTAINNYRGLEIVSIRVRYRLETADGLVTNAVTTCPQPTS